MNIRKRKALRARAIAARQAAAEAAAAPKPVVEPVVEVAPEPIVFEEAPVIEEALAPKPKRRTRRTKKTTKE